MLEGYVTNLFVSYLGRYIKNLNKDAVTVSILKGYIQMNDVELTRLALQHFGLPVYVSRGVVGNLKINVPWTKLTSKPCELFVEDVVLVVVPRTAIHWNDADEEALAQQEKKDQLNIYDATRQAKMEQEKDKGKGLTAKIQQAVFNNLRITISNVVIRYEDSVSLFNKSYYSLITINKVTCMPTDSQFKLTFIEGQPKYAHKQISFADMAIYVGVVDDISEQVSLFPAGAESNMQFREKVLLLTRTVNPRDLLLPPSSLVMNVRLLIMKDPVEPKIFGSCALQSSDVVRINEQQYEALTVIQHYLTHAGILAKARQTRPLVSPKERPRMWWKHAITQVIDEIRSKRKRTHINWEVYCEWKEKRNEYIDLFLRSQKGSGLPVLDKVGEKRLGELEEWMCYEDIALCRDHAYLVLDHRKRAQSPLLTTPKENSDLLKDIIANELGIEQEMPPDYVHTKLKMDFPTLSIMLIDHCGEFCQFDLTNLHLDTQLATQSTKYSVTIKDMGQQRADGFAPFFHFNGDNSPNVPGSSSFGLLTPTKGPSRSHSRTGSLMEPSPRGHSRTNSGSAMHRGHSRTPSNVSLGSHDGDLALMSPGGSHLTNMSRRRSMLPVIEVRYASERGVKTDTWIALRPATVSVDREYLRRLKRFFSSSDSTRQGDATVEEKEPPVLHDELEARKALRSLLATIGQSQHVVHVLTKAITLELEGVVVRCHELKYEAEFDPKTQFHDRADDSFYSESVVKMDKVDVACDGEMVMEMTGMRVVTEKLLVSNYVCKPLSRVHVYCDVAAMPMPLAATEHTKKRLQDISNFISSLSSANTGKGTPNPPPRSPAGAVAQQEKFILDFSTDFLTIGATPEVRLCYRSCVATWTSRPLDIATTFVARMTSDSGVIDGKVTCDYTGIWPGSKLRNDRDADTRIVASLSDGHIHVCPALAALNEYHYDLMILCLYQRENYGKPLVDMGKPNSWGRYSLTNVNIVHDLIQDPIANQERFPESANTIDSHIPAVEIEYLRFPSGSKMGIKPFAMTTGVNTSTTKPDQDHLLCNFHSLSMVQDFQMGTKEGSNVTAPSRITRVECESMKSTYNMLWVSEFFAYMLQSPSIIRLSSVGTRPYFTSDSPMGSPLGTDPSGLPTVNKMDVQIKRITSGLPQSVSSSMDVVNSNVHIFTGDDSRTNIETTVACVFSDQLLKMDRIPLLVQLPGASDDCMNIVVHPNQKDKFAIDCQSYSSLMNAVAILLELSAKSSGVEEKRSGGTTKRILLPSTSVRLEEEGVVIDTNVGNIVMDPNSKTWMDMSTDRLAVSQRGSKTPFFQSTATKDSGVPTFRLQRSDENMMYTFDSCESTICPQMLKLIESVKRYQIRESTATTAAPSSYQTTYSVGDLELVLPYKVNRPNAGSVNDTIFSMKSINFTQTGDAPIATVGDLTAKTREGVDVLHFSSSSDSDDHCISTTAEQDSSGNNILLVSMKRPVTATFLPQVSDATENLFASKDWVSCAEVFQPPDDGSPLDIIADCETDTDEETGATAPRFVGKQSEGRLVRLDISHPTIIFRPEERGHHLKAQCDTLQFGSGTLKFKKASAYAVPLEGEPSTIVSDIDAVLDGTDADGGSSVHIDSIQVFLTTETYRLLLQSVSLLRKVKPKQPARPRGSTMSTPQPRSPAVGYGRRLHVDPEPATPASQSTVTELNFSTTSSGKASRTLHLRLPRVTINIDTGSSTGVLLLESVFLESHANVIDFNSGALMLTLDSADYPLVALEHGVQAEVFTDSDQVQQVRVTGSTCNMVLEPTSFTTLFDFFVPPLRHHLLLRDPSKTRLVPIRSNLTLSEDVELCRTGKVWHVVSRDNNYICIDLGGHTLSLSLSESIDADIVLVVDSGISVVITNGVIKVPCKTSRQQKELSSTFESFYVCGEGSYVQCMDSVSLVPVHCPPDSGTVKLAGKADISLAVDVKMSVVPGTGPAKGQRLTLLCPVDTTVKQRPEGSEVIGTLEKVVVQTESLRETSFTGELSPQSASMYTRKILVTDAVRMTMNAPLNDVRQVVMIVPPIEAKVLSEDVCLVEELAKQLSLLSNSKRFRSDQQRKVMDAIVTASKWRRGVNLEQDAAISTALTSVIIVNAPRASLVIGDSSVPLFHFLVEDCTSKITTSATFVAGDFNTAISGEYFHIDTSTYHSFLKPTPLTSSMKRSWRLCSNSFAQLTLQHPRMHVSPPFISNVDKFQKTYIERSQQRSDSGIIGLASPTGRADATHIFENRFATPMHIKVHSSTNPAEFDVPANGGCHPCVFSRQGIGEVIVMSMAGQPAWEIPFSSIQGQSSIVLPGTSRRLILRSDGGKVRLIFLSTLVFRNALDIPIDLIDSKDPTRVLIPIPANSDSHAFDGSTQNSFFARMRDGSTDMCPLPLNLNSLHMHQPTEFSLVAASGKLNMMVSVEDDAKLVLIQPLYTICNNIGRDVHIRAYQGRQLTVIGDNMVKNGGKLALPAFDAQQSLKLALQVEQVSGEVMTSPEAIEIFPSLQRRESTALIRMKDSNNTTFYVHVSVGKYLCALHVAFWVYNQTEFSILLTDSTISKTLTAGQMNHTGIPPSHGSPFLLGCKTADIGSVMVKVGLDGKWSDSFKLDFGENGVVESNVEGCKLIRSVNYTVQFPRYQKGIPPILRFTPRWVFINKSASRLLFRVSNKKSVPNDSVFSFGSPKHTNTNISDVVVDLKPGAMHSSCDNGKTGNCLSLQHVNEDRNSMVRSQWSGFVSIDEVFERTMNLWGHIQHIDPTAAEQDARFPAGPQTQSQFDVVNRGELVNGDAFADDIITTTVRIVGCLDNGVLVVTACDVTVAPLIVQNRLNSLVCVRQRDSCRTLTIAPRTSINFHWDDPEGVRVLLLQHLDGSKSSRTLDFSMLEGTVINETNSPPSQIRLWRSTTDLYTFIALVQDNQLDRVLHYWKVSWSLCVHLQSMSLVVGDKSNNNRLVLAGTSNMNMNLEDREVSTVISVAHMQADDCKRNVPVMYCATSGVDDVVKVSLTQVLSDSGIRHVRNGRVHMEPLVINTTDHFLSEMITVVSKDYVQSLQLEQFDSAMSIQMMGTRDFVDHLIQNSEARYGKHAPQNQLAADGSDDFTEEAVVASGGGFQGSPRLLVERYEMGKIILFFNLRRHTGGEDPLREHLGFYALMVPDVKEARFTWGEYTLNKFLATTDGVKRLLARYYWSRATDQWHKLTSVGNFMDKLTKASVKLPPPPPVAEID